MLEKMMVVMAAHFVGDFAFQNEYIATQKGKSWEINFYHAAIYTSSIILAWVFFAHSSLSLLSVTLILISHLFIDAAKSRWHIIKYIWQDQLLHAIVLMIVIFYIELP